MSTFPLMHASSPAVVKTNNTTRTIGTAAFDPPSRITIVAGVTSDADTNAGAAPTISPITGLTWTRVGPNLGFGGAGDVGVVALFAGVLDNPNTDLGSISVTVDTNITVLKPKMLVVRVYDETQVDISDPIGALLSGSFATSTSWSAALTPETSEGGVRGLHLDWNATGTPTVLLPNDANTEIVDAFHNAGLSTNVQISGQKRTRAGVAHAIGVNLLGTSSDGNWVAYELRGPQPAAGPAFTSGTFSSPAFEVPSSGTTIPRSTSESTTTSDSAARTLSQPRGAAESTSTADTSTRTVARPRSAAETTTTLDAAARTVSQARAVAETTTTSDSSANAITHVIARSVTEATTTSDTTARGAMVYGRSTSEATTTSDSAARTTSRPRTATESTSTADASTRTVARPRSAAETTTTADSSSAARTGAPRTRSTSETTTTTDTSSASTTGIVSRATSEATSTSDTPTRLTTRGRAAGETTSTSDGCNRRTARGRLQLETTSSSDLAARAIASSRQQLETLTTVDVCAPTMGLPPFDIQILRVAGRQRHVTMASRSALTFTATGRPAEQPLASRSRTFRWTGRPRPPTPGSRP